MRATDADRHGLEDEGIRMLGCLFEALPAVPDADLRERMIDAALGVLSGLADRADREGLLERAEAYRLLALAGSLLSPHEPDLSLTAALSVAVAYCDEPGADLIVRAVLGDGAE